MIRALAHVAAEDETVVQPRLQLLESFTVALEGEMNIADRPEASRRVRRRSRRS